MNTPSSRPATSYQRRIVALAIAIAAAVTAYTAGWFYVASKGDALVHGFLASSKGGSRQYGCDNPVIRGFPFRIGLFCDAASIDDQASGARLSVARLRTAAQVYALDHRVIEIDGPMLIDMPGAVPLAVDFEAARASTVGKDALADRISVELRKAMLSERQPTDLHRPLAKAERVGLHMRQADGDRVDLAADIEAFQPGETLQTGSAPAASLTLRGSLDGAAGFDIALRAGIHDLTMLRGHAGTLDTLEIAFASGGRIQLDGPFSVSDDGIVNATVTLRIADTVPLVDAIAKFAQAFGRTTPDLSLLTLADNQVMKITINNGQASIGVIPLGQIPPL